MSSNLNPSPNLNPNPNPNPHTNPNQVLSDVFVRVYAERTARHAATCETMLWVRYLVTTP
eukprot:scaffold59690_cov37-Phaeocystis_antarctica.AAC.1